MDTKDYDLYLRGATALSNKDFEKACSLLSESANLNPHFKTYEQLYLALKALGKDSEANTCLEKAYNLNKKNNKTASMYAGILIEMQNIEDAKSVLLDILHRSPTYGPAQRLLNDLQST